MRGILKAAVILSGLIGAASAGAIEQIRPPDGNAGTSLTESMVFAGIRGSVVALDRRSGNALWSTHLSGGDFVNVVILGGDLYASTRGEIFCVEAATGRIRWHNALKGYGRGLMTMAGSGIVENQAPAARAKKHREEEEAAAQIP